MIKIEVLVPIIVVVMLGSELMLSPFKLHVIEIGVSPCDTVQAPAASGEQEHAGSAGRGGRQEPWTTSAVSKPHEKEMTAPTPFPTASAVPQRVSQREALTSGDQAKPSSPGPASSA